MEYRWATRDDKDIIAKLMIEASGGLCEYILKDFSKYIELYKVLSFELLRSDSPLFLENNLLLCLQDKVVGVLCCYPIEQFIVQIDKIKSQEQQQMLKDFYNIPIKNNTLYIDTLCIDAKYRGYGTGFLMLQGIKHFLKKYPSPYIGLYVWGNNHIAHNLYLKLGFVQEFVKRVQGDDFPIKHDRIFMRVLAQQLLENLDYRCDRTVTH